MRAAVARMKRTKAHVAFGHHRLQAAIDLFGRRKAVVLRAVSVASS
jgi:hypothetical protein